jgi:phenylpyruvate tautomerase PptA (4-oxalocrotonate tautomerase family)
MPYLRLYSPELSLDQKRRIARELTEAMMKILHQKEDERYWCTLQFVPYRLEDFAVGGRLAYDSMQADYYLEYGDHHLTQERREKIAQGLTPLLAELLDLKPTETHRIQIQFKPFDTRDLTIGGTALSRFLKTG